MTKFQPYKKGTVLALSGRIDHLHVICNDPVHYPIDGCDCVLAVNISSVKLGVPYDATCILRAGIIHSCVTIVMLYMQKQLYGS